MLDNCLYFILGDYKTLTTLTEADGFGVTPTAPLLLPGNTYPADFKCNQVIDGLLDYYMIGFNGDSMGVVIITPRFETTMELLNNLDDHVNVDAKNLSVKRAVKRILHNTYSALAKYDV